MQHTSHINSLTTKNLGIDKFARVEYRCKFKSK